MSSAEPSELPDPQQSRAVLLAGSLDVERSLLDLQDLLCDERLWGLPRDNCVVQHITQPTFDLTTLTDLAKDTGRSGTLLVYACAPGLLDLGGITDLADLVPRLVIIFDGQGGFDFAAFPFKQGIVSVLYTSYLLGSNPEDYSSLFTGTFIDLLRTGIPAGPELLDVRTICSVLRQRLPEVTIEFMGTSGVDQPLVRNVADQDMPVHERLLHEGLQAAAQSSGLTVLVGDWGTGKSTIAHQATQTALPDWPVLTPQSMDDLTPSGPGSVFMLHELDRWVPPGRKPERFAQRLLNLLTDTRSAPVVVIATATPETWARFATAETSPAVTALLRFANVVQVEPDLWTTRHVWEVRTRGYGDRPPKEDLLQRTAMVEALADLISPTNASSEHDRSGPTVIALDGAWGIGKTSLVKLIKDRLEKTERPTLPAKEASRLRAYEADRALSGRPLWAHDLMPQANKAAEHAPLITATFEPWAHQTSEQVWAGLTDTLLGAVRETLLPQDNPATERYWFQRNLDRVDRMRLRRALRKSVLSPLLAVSVLALAVPLVAQMARSTDTYRLANWVIAGSNIALLIAGSVFLAGIGHTLWRYFRRDAKEFLPADLFVGPVPSGTDDAAVRDPYHNARSGYLYLAQHDVFAVLDDVQKAGHHMIVYIDDLDRCTPRTTAEVFEAINLFITHHFPVTRFVLCLDTTTVAAHLDDVYASLKGRALHGDDPTPGWSFLRKLIQLPIPIPPISPTHVTGLLNNLLGEPARDAQPTTVDTLQPDPPFFLDIPTRTPPLLPESVVTAVVEIFEHHEDIRQRMTERLEEQHSLSVREAKRMLTIWQYYVRVLTRLGSPTVDQARHLVVLAEIIARWPAAQRSLHRRVDNEHGLELLAKAADDDWAWAQALRRLELHTPAHQKCADGVRDLLRRYEGDRLAALATRLT